MNFNLEVIGFTLDACIKAQAAGVHRIELCDNVGEGGTTPSYGFIKAAREILSIGLYPMIRPRGGDFLYSDAEFEAMKTDLMRCKQLGCDGVVFGMLLPDGRIDKKRMSALIELAYPMGVTMHRAFDRSADPFLALEDAIDIGCERILTSGQKPTVMEGADLIAKLIQKAEDRIIIMPGSGLKSTNVAELAKRTGAREFHTSARTDISSRMEYNNNSMKENLKSVSVDEEEIKKIINHLRELPS